MGGRNSLLGAILAQVLQNSLNQPCDDPNCEGCQELRKLLEAGSGNGQKAAQEPRVELLGTRDKATLEADVVILKQAQKIFEREADLTRDRASAEGFPPELAAKAREIYSEQREGLRRIKQMAGMLELRLLTLQGGPVEVSIEFVSV